MWRRLDGHRGSEIDGAGARQRTTVHQRRQRGDTADAYGRFVDQNLIAVNHDHYFNFRLDIDVDGPTNTFVADRLVTKTLPAENPRRSLWVREPMTPRTESEAMLHMDMQRPALWRVLSTTRSNHVGYPTSYQLMPGMAINTLLTPDDYPRRRAGFIDHQLWVTPYRAEERFAAGDYPTLSTPGQGLPAWTKANRRVEQSDVVLWDTTGMHHVVRAEDWPVMPVLWHSFELRPFDFSIAIRRWISRAVEHGELLLRSLSCGLVLCLAVGAMTPAAQEAVDARWSRVWERSMARVQSSRSASFGAFPDSAVTAGRTHSSC